MRSIRMRVGQVRNFSADVQRPCIDEKRSKRQINTEYVGLFETDKRVRTGADGWGTFTCRPGSLEVWVPRITEA